MWQLVKDLFKLAFTSNGEKSSKAKNEPGVIWYCRFCGVWVKGELGDSHQETKMALTTCPKCKKK